MYAAGNPACKASFFASWSSAGSFRRCFSLTLSGSAAAMMTESGTTCPNTERFFWSMIRSTIYRNREGIAREPSPSFRAGPWHAHVWERSHPPLWCGDGLIPLSRTSFPVRSSVDIIYYVEERARSHQMPTQQCGAHNLNNSALDYF